MIEAPFGEKISSWFAEAESFERIEVISRLFHLCLPHEINYFKNYLSGIINSYSSELLSRDEERKSNDMKEYNFFLEKTSKDAILSSNTIKLMSIKLTYLKFDNFKCANKIFKFIKNLYPHVVDHLKSAFLWEDDLLHDLLLLLTLARFHLGFVFSQQITLCYFYNNIHSTIQQKQKTDKKDSLLNFKPSFDSAGDGIRFHDPNNTLTSSVPSTSSGKDFVSPLQSIKNNSKLSDKQCNKTNNHMFPPIASFSSSFFSNSIFTEPTHSLSSSNQYSPPYPTSNHSPYSNLSKGSHGYENDGCLLLKDRSQGYFIEPEEEEVEDDEKVGEEEEEDDDVGLEMKNVKQEEYEKKLISNKIRKLKSFNSNTVLPGLNSITCNYKRQTNPNLIHHLLNPINNIISTTILTTTSLSSLTTAFSSNNNKQQILSLESSSNEDYQTPLSSPKLQHHPIHPHHHDYLNQQQQQQLPSTATTSCFSFNCDSFILNSTSSNSNFYTSNYSISNNNNIITNVDNSNNKNENNNNNNNDNINNNNDNINNDNIDILTENINSLNVVLDKKISNNNNNNNKTININNNNNNNNNKSNLNGIIKDINIIEPSINNINNINNENNKNNNNNNNSNNNNNNNNNKICNNDNIFNMTSSINTYELRPQTTLYSPHTSSPSSSPSSSSSLSLFSFSIPPLPSITHSSPISSSISSSIYPFSSPLSSSFSSSAHNVVVTVTSTKNKNFNSHYSPASSSIPLQQQNPPIQQPIHFYQQQQQQLHPRITTEHHQQNNLLLEPPNSYYSDVSDPLLSSYSSSFPLSSSPPSSSSSSLQPEDQFVYSTLPHPSQSFIYYDTNSNNFYFPFYMNPPHPANQQHVIISQPQQIIQQQQQQQQQQHQHQQHPQIIYSFYPPYPAPYPPHPPLIPAQLPLLPSSGYVEHEDEVFDNVDADSTFTPTTSHPSSIPLDIPFNQFHHFPPPFPSSFQTVPHTFIPHPPPFLLQPPPAPLSSSISFQPRENKIKICANCSKRNHTFLECSENDINSSLKIS